MTRTARLLTFLVFMIPLPLAAGFLSSEVVVLGEVHDNPHHHARQATLITQIAPKAVVFEMLRPGEARRLDETPRGAETMQARAADVDWPNFTDYLDVLLVSPKIVGAALPRDRVRAAFAEGAAAIFGPDAPEYGLDDPLPEAQRAARIELQFNAHCAAMPREMMGGMIEAQRLRDAAFARTVLAALDTYGAPVVLITGNGHARTDWGVPAYLRNARPGLTVFSLGQGEEGRALDAPFDRVERAPPPDREDPCRAFQ